MFGSLMQMLNDPEAMQQFAELLPKLQALIEQVDRIERKVNLIGSIVVRDGGRTEEAAVWEMLTDGPTS